ncbi:MAG: type II secretion system protein L [Lysobacterales bacterium]|jgi:general secretion pathway protein L|nr:MAG: type II secretion system protein L [Xanthomonadales bacterium]
MAIAADTERILARLKLRYQRSSLPAFFRWWGGELKALLPRAWREAIARRPRAVYVIGEGNRLHLRRPDGEELTAVALEDPPAERRLRIVEALAALGEERPPVILAVPADRALRRRLRFPEAVEESLEQALVYEIDRQTPFRAEEVYFGVRLVDRDREARQVEVELVVVPRAIADPWLAAARESGLPVFGLDACDEEGNPLGFNLLPRGERVRLPDRRRRLNLILAATASVLALIAMHLWLANREHALSRMRAEVERLREEARTVAALREELERAVASARFLSERRSKQPPLILVMDELSRIIPDDTFLEQLNVSQGQAALRGLSPSAANLIGLLQQSRYLAEPSFQSAIQPDPRYGKERFDLKAVLKAHVGEPSS